jgi:hypothetical protein
MQTQVVPKYNNVKKEYETSVTVIRSLKRKKSYLKYGKNREYDKKK